MKKKSIIAVVPYMVADAHLSSKKLGELTPLLQDLQTFRRYRKALDRKEQLMASLKVLADLEDSLPAAVYDAGCQTLAALVHTCAREAEQALGELRKSGWRRDDTIPGGFKAGPEGFKPDRKKPHDRGGSRPIHLFTVAVAESYQRVDPDIPDHHGKNSLRVRQAIALDLHGLFNEKELVTGVDEPIQIALKRLQTAHQI